MEVGDIPDVAEIVTSNMAEYKGITSVNRTTESLVRLLAQWVTAQGILAAVAESNGTVVGIVVARSIPIAAGVRGAVRGMVLYSKKGHRRFEVYKVLIDAMFAHARQRKNGSVIIPVNTTLPDGLKKQIVDYIDGTEVFTEYAKDVN